MENKLAISAKMCILDSMGRNLLSQLKSKRLTGGGGLTNIPNQGIVLPKAVAGYFIGAKT